MLIYMLLNCNRLGNMLLIVLANCLKMAGLDTPVNVFVGGEGLQLHLHLHNKNM